jgi:YVTN family beta-propeller protein
VLVEGTNQVKVIDTTTNTVVGDAITVGDEPLRIAINNVAVSPDDSRVYVTSFPEGTVTVIDAASNTVIATKSFVDNNDPTKTETNIGRMEFNPVASRNLAYITDVQDAQVLVVNTDPTSAGYMTVVQRVDIPETGDLAPQGIAVSADGNRVYVPIGFVETSTVAVIDTDTDTVIANIPVGNNPGGVAATPDGTRVYVPNFVRETGNGESNDSDDGVSVIAVLVPATEV